MWHYDLRYVCPKTGQLEATEDMGLSFKRAIRAMLWAENKSEANYQIVSCDRPASDLVHHVDLEHHVHMAVHEGFNQEYVGYVGAPSDTLFNIDGGPELA